MTATILEPMYEGLVLRDREMKIAPSLATAWSSSEGGKVWTFKLRPGVTFHDGSKLDAEAVVHNFARFLDPKRGLAAAVSTDHVDAIYAKARQAGALGGKLLGAGGGGFILLFVPLDERAAVRDSMAGLVEVSFDIDHDGSSIVLYRPEEPGRR